MSVTLSELAAQALLRVASSPGHRRSRMLLRGLGEASAESVHEALVDHLDLDIELALGGEAVRIGGASVPGGVLIPFLVGQPSANSGSRGFAAALRTHMLDDAMPDAALLILDPSPVETVLSATEDAAALPELSWPSLASSAAAAVARDAGMPAHPWADEVLAAVSSGLIPEPAFSDWLEWLQATVSAGEAFAGTELWRLGNVLSDPKAFVAAPAPWERSAKLRREFDERFASSARPYADEVRRLYGRKLDSAIVEKVANAAGPFGLDYSKLIVRELIVSRPGPEPLELEAQAPFEGAFATLASDATLVVWASGAACELHLTLNRPAAHLDGIAVRLADNPAVDCSLQPGQQVGTVYLPGASIGWQWGALELGTRGSDGKLVSSQTFDLAVYRADGDWFPIDAAMAVDAEQAAFECDAEPKPLAIGVGGDLLGAAEHEELALDGPDREELRVSFNGAEAVLPIVVTGFGSPGGDAPGSGEDGEGGTEEAEHSADGAVLVATVGHAMLHAARDTWPSIPAGDAAKEFVIGTTRYALAAQEPAGMAGAALEKEILEHPDWLAFSTDAGGEVRQARTQPQPGDFYDARLLQAFQEARGEFFAAARAAGTVYAVDPRGDVARHYINAYLQLLRSVPARERYRPELDYLLACDSVAAGPLGLLIAPTNPFAVAFHLALTEQFADWIAAGDIPAPADVRSISIRHAVPLLNFAPHWYESAACSGALWRRYVRLSQDAPGIPERNRDFIARRLHFFLEVHPAYRRPDQVLAVSFHEPPDAATVVRPLKAFYESEHRQEHYELPRLEVTIIGGPPNVGRDVAVLLGGEEQTEAEREKLRVLQSRVTVSVRARGAESPFAHVCFLLRSPGQREPQALRLTDRPPTTYLGGLAAVPGRNAYDQLDPMFAWGTWARGGNELTDYEEMLRRSLELVHGQRHERLEPGWTKMAATTLLHERMGEFYESAIWVVHLDRLIGIEAFRPRPDESERQLIDYEERADPEQPGYDGITATERVEPYLAVIGRALANLGSPQPDALQSLLRVLNAVSGRWAMQLLHRPANDILERVGTIAAIRALCARDNAVGGQAGGTGVLIALDEIIPRKQHAGVPGGSVPVNLPDGRMCDDLLLAWVPDDSDGPVVISGVVTEVKYASEGSPDLDGAAGEVNRTRAWLDEVFNVRGSSRAFRARDLSQLLRAAASRAATFGLGAEPSAGFERALTKIADGDYEFQFRHWRDGSERAGLVVAVEAESSVSSAQGRLPVPGNDLDHVRLGRPALDDIIKDRAPRAAAHWAPIKFAAPEQPAQAGAAPATADAGQQADARASDGAPAPSEPVPPAQDQATAAVPPEVVEMAAALDAALAKYRLPCDPCDPGLAQLGPSIIRFRTRPMGALSIGAIEAKARDLGREVGSPSPVLVTQEPHYVCIDVPRRERQTVPYFEQMGAGGEQAAAGALGIVMGLAPSGVVRTADLARLPHLLVAGATGSGKSVFLRAMLCELVRTRGPARLKLVIIDPKGLDFAGFSGLPHLHGGRIITDPFEAVEQLQSIIEQELEWRRPRLIDAGATNVTELYEQGVAVRDFPQMVILVDEFADLAAVLDRPARASFMAAVQRYVQLTRAFGIHIVLATQRPSADVITGTIKANLTARVALSLPSHTDSMTVIDRAGAEDLLGDGDLLFYSAGQVERLQGVFASPADVNLAVERWQGVRDTEPS